MVAKTRSFPTKHLLSSRCFLLLIGSKENSEVLVNLFEDGDDLALFLFGKDGGDGFAGLFLFVTEECFK